jgi:hypothetical protein
MPPFCPLVFLLILLQIRYLLASLDLWKTLFAVALVTAVVTQAPLLLGLHQLAVLKFGWTLLLLEALSTCAGPATRSLLVIPEVLRLGGCKYGRTADTGCLLSGPWIGTHLGLAKSRWVVLYLCQLKIRNEPNKLTYVTDRYTVLRIVLQASPSS